jgi:hypothetical protein
VAVAAGCAKHAVSVTPPSPSGIIAERCAHLGNLLPQQLESLRPRVITPRSPLVHVWGSPPVVLACGVEQPSGYSATSSETTVVDGVQWFEQPGSDTVVWTAIGRPTGSGPAVNVRLAVPTSYQGQGAFLVDLARPLKAAVM